MKKFFNKSIGRMVNLLSPQEAMQITKMYINHCIGKEVMSGVRLKMISYLYDFMAFSNINDINMFIKMLKEEKDSQNLGKEERSCYEKILEFFDSYKTYSNSEDVDIEQASNYIITMENMKKELIEKENRGQELNFNEKLLNGLFLNGFEFSSFALHICELYENKMKAAINSGNEIDIPLEQELAYYNLHDFSSTGDISKIESKKNDDKAKNYENTNKSNVVKPVGVNEKADAISEPKIIDKQPEVSPVEIKVDIPVTEEVKVNDVPVSEIKEKVQPKSEKVEENIPTINIGEVEEKEEIPQINISIPVDDKNETVKQEVAKPQTVNEAKQNQTAKVQEEEPKQVQEKVETPTITVEIPKEDKEVKKEPEKPKQEPKPQQSATAPRKPFISADDILKATQEINSGDAFGYFGDSIDRRNSYSSNNDDSSFDGTGGFRD